MKILAKIKLITSQVLRRPYEGNVYFQIKGAAINLKLNGKIAIENRLRIE